MAPIGKVELVVNEDAFDAEILFDVEPCEFEFMEEYSFTVTDKATGLLIDPAPYIFDQYDEYFEIDYPEDSDIGEYEVEVCHELVDIMDIACVKFDLRIRPCWVETLTINEEFDFIFYKIGGPEIASVGKMTFTQTPDCGVPVLIDDSVLTTSYIVVNQDTSDFSVPEVTTATSAGDAAIVQISAYIDCVATGGCKDGQLKSSNTFELEYEIINPCDETKVTFEVDTINYIIGSAESVVTLMVPTDTQSFRYGSKDGESFCGITRTIELKDSPNGNWYNFDPTTRELSIETSQISDADTYQFTMKANLDDLGKSTTTTFDVEILCQVDDVTTSIPVQDRTFSLGPDPLVFSTNAFTITPNCDYDLEYEAKLYVSATDTYTGLPSFMSFKNQAFEIQTEDDSKLGEYLITIGAKYNGNPAVVFAQTVYNFTLTVAPPCTPPELIPIANQDTYTFSLWQDLVIDFTSMCGVDNHELVYLSGPLSSVKRLNFLQFFTQEISALDEYSFTAPLFESRKWVGTHKLSIQGTNDWFKVTASAEINLVITNPCDETVINDDGSLEVFDLLPADRQSFIARRYEGPTDSASSEFGDGYDKCGPRKYSFVDSNGLELVLNGLDVKVNRFDQGPDKLFMSMTTLPSGQETILNAFLKIELKEYPGGSFYQSPIQILIRDCTPNEFKAVEIANQTLIVQEFDPYDIFVDFDQSPCDLPQTYSFQVFDKLTELQILVPDFLTVIDNVVVVSAPRFDEVGEYEIELCSKVIHLSACTRFNTTVILAEEYLETAPEILIKTAKQRVQVGEDLAYTFSVTPDEVAGFDMEVSLILGNTKKFTAFNQETKTMQVLGQLISQDDINDYQIQVKVEVYNSESSFVTTQNFTLTVWDYEREAPTPTPPIIEPKKEKEIEVEGRLIDPRMQEKYMRVEPQDPELDSQRPIPYISDLRSDGTLTISWDTKMVPLEEFTSIPETQVAIDAEIGFESLRFWQKQRNLQTEVEREISRETDPEIVYFVDEEAITYERIRLLQSLEIKVTPDDPDRENDSKLDWKVTGYDNENVYIKLLFSQPDKVSQDQALDTLSITFWGVDFFKNELGTSVKQGTTLYNPISRQFSDQSQIDDTDTASQLFTDLAIACLILAIPAIATGTLLPVWIFVNAVQIISHLILLNTLMPANAHAFLRKVNDLIRWHHDDVQKWVEQEWSLPRYELDEGSYGPVMQMAGYKHMFVQNLSLVIAVFVGLVILLALVIVKDVISRCASRNLIKKRNQQSSPWCQNFILRFVYEFSLELCICALLQLTIEDEESTSHQILALFVCAVLAILVLYIVSLFCFNGPYVHGFFTKWTCCKSCFSIRPRDSRNWQKYMESHPEKQMESPFLSYFVNLCCFKRVTFFKSLLPKSLIVDVPHKVNKVSYIPNESLEGTVDMDPVQTDRALITQTASARGVMFHHGQEQMQGAERLSKGDTHQGASNNLQYSKRFDEEFEGGEGEQQDNQLVLSSLGSNNPEVMIQDQQHYAAKVDDQVQSESSANSSYFDELNRQEAQLRVSFERRSTPSKRSKTLHFGLHENHVRNVAIIHPLMFLVRRVVYALVIVFMNDVTIWPVFIVMGSCLAMLAYALSEHQWKDRAINYQHIWNEVVIYIVCVFLLAYSKFVDDVEIRMSLGWALIIACLCFLVINFMIILVYTIRSLQLHLKRLVLLYRRDQLRLWVLKLVRRMNFDISLIQTPPKMQSANSSMFMVQEKPWLGKRQFIAFDGIGGGFGAEIYVGRSAENRKTEKGEDAGSMKNSLMFNEEEKQGRETGLQMTEWKPTPEPVDYVQNIVPSRTSPKAQNRDSINLPPIVSNDRKVEQFKTKFVKTPKHKNPKNFEKNAKKKLLMTLSMEGSMEEASNHALMLGGSNIPIRLSRDDKAKLHAVQSLSEAIATSSDHTNQNDTDQKSGQEQIPITASQDLGQAVWQVEKYAPLPYETQTQVSFDQTRMASQERTMEQNNNGPSQSNGPGNLKKFIQNAAKKDSVELAMAAQQDRVSEESPQDGASSDQDRDSVDEMAKTMGLGFMKRKNNDNQGGSMFNQRNSNEKAVMPTSSGDSAKLPKINILKNYKDQSNLFGSKKPTPQNIFKQQVEAKQVVTTKPLPTATKWATNKTKQFGATMGAETSQRNQDNTVYGLKTGSSKEASGSKIALGKSKERQSSIISNANAPNQDLASVKVGQESATQIQVQAKGDETGTFSQASGTAKTQRLVQDAQAARLQAAQKHIRPIQSSYVVGQNENIVNGASSEAYMSKQDDQASKQSSGAAEKSRRSLSNAGLQSLNLDSDSNKQRQGSVKGVVNGSGSIQNDIKASSGMALGESGSLGSGGMM